MENEEIIEMLSENFSLRELMRTNYPECQSEPTAKEKANLRLLARQVLQPLRDAWGDALTVNSGYRSLLLNSRVRGAKNSYHLQGRAADIDCGQDAAKAMRLALLCREMLLPVTEVIVSRRGQHYWLHVALRTATDRKKAVFILKEY